MPLDSFILETTLLDCTVSQGQAAVVKTIASYYSSYHNNNYYYYH